MNWTEERRFGACLDELQRCEYKTFIYDDGSTDYTKKPSEAELKRLMECEEFNEQRPFEDWADYEAAAQLDWECDEDFGEGDTVICRFSASDDRYQYHAEIRYWDDNDSYSQRVMQPKTKLEEILILCLMERLAEKVKQPK